MTDPVEPTREEVELEIDEDVVKALEAIALEYNVSLDLIVEVIMARYIKKSQGQDVDKIDCTITWLMEHFDEVMLRTSLDVAEYFVYRTEQSERPQVVLIPIDTYTTMIKAITDGRIDKISS